MNGPALPKDKQNDDNNYDKICKIVFAFQMDLGGKIKEIKKYLPRAEDHYDNALAKFTKFHDCTDYTIWDSFCMAVNEEITCFKTQIALARGLKKSSKADRHIIGQTLFGSPTEMELGCFHCHERCSLKKLSVIL